MITTRKLLLLSMLLCSAGIIRAAGKSDYYEIKVYHVTTIEQVKQVEAFIQNDYMPALHRIGVSKVGVYHPVFNDTMSDKRVYVFIPLKSLSHLDEVEEAMSSDPSINNANNNYWNTAFNASPFKRIETIVLKAFPLMTSYKAPSLSGKVTDHVYELRSYESATERLNRQKVKMFNEGGEVALFKRLEFNAVFYAEVIAGSHMPNLMYMTSFNNMAERDEHWKKFGSDPEWVKLKDLPEYANTVSKNDTVLLNPAEFTEL